MVQKNVSWGMVILFSWSSRSLSLYLGDGGIFPGSVLHTGCIKYQKHFSGTSAPLVARSKPAHKPSESCIQLVTASTMFVFNVMHRSTSSANPKPVSWLVCEDIVYITRAKKPSSVSI